MVLKKKKTAQVSEAINQHQPVVTQVVEVVEEELQPEEDTKEPKPEEHVAVAEVSARLVSPSPPEEQGFGEREEHQKETVAELFKRPTPSVMPEISMHRGGSRKKSPLLFILMVIVIVALLGGGVFVAKRKSGSIATLFTAPTPTPTPAPTPTPTPQPVNRSDIKIQVLNGGGVPGAAGKMKSLLEDKGYTVADVSNADSYTYDKTEVQVKAGKEAYQKLLMDDLKDTYSLASNAATLSSDSSYDARVVVGKQ